MASLAVQKSRLVTKMEQPQSKWHHPHSHYAGVPSAFFPNQRIFQTCKEHSRAAISRSEKGSTSRWAKQVYFLQVYTNALQIPHTFLYLSVGAIYFWSTAKARSLIILGVTVRGTPDQNHPLWLGLRITTCMSYLTTGGPGKELGTNKLPPTGRIQQRSGGERRLHMSYQPPRILLPEIHLG